VRSPRRANPSIRPIPRSPFYSAGLPSPACQHPNLASARTTHSKLFFFLLPPFPFSVPTSAFRLLFSQLARTSFLFSASRSRYFSDKGRLKGVHLISSHLIADCQSYRDLHTVDACTAILRIRQSIGSR
jgi:hypothetical protein